MNSAKDQELVKQEKNSVPDRASSPLPALETGDSILRLTYETQARWESDLDALGFAEGFKDRLSQCVNNLDGFFGFTPREALQQGWYDYAEDDEGE